MTMETEAESAGSGRRPPARPPMHRMLAFGLVAGVLSGLFAWERSWRPKHWGEVVQGLVFRSGRSTPDAVEGVIRSRGIEVVVDLNHRDGSPLQAAEQRACERIGAEYLVCPLAGDGTGAVESYARAVAALCVAARDGKKAWVHCAAGAQRTGGTTAAFRLLYERRSPSEVRAEMARYGWRAGRDDVLWDYLVAHLPEVDRRLQQRGIDSRLPQPWPPTEFPASTAVQAAVQEEALLRR